MAKPKKPAAAPKAKSLTKSDSPSWRRRVVMHLLIAIAFAGSGAALFRVCKTFVDRDVANPTRPVHVVLDNRPAWMSDLLCEQILHAAEPVGLHSAFDQQLLVKTVKTLQADPWVRQVRQVRRVFDQSPGDTLAIDCDFRAPVALVRWGDYYWLVDADGARLPEQYTGAELPKIIFGADGRMNIRIISGVTHAPSATGQVWLGDDLGAGVQMARLLAGRACAEQIRVIDVSNFNGRHDRREAQIVLYTQFGTQIRWGRPPQADDDFVEVSAAAKLAALDAIYTARGRVDAGQPWIDVRFDRVTCPGQNSSGEARSVDASTN